MNEPHQFMKNYRPDIYSFKREFCLVILLSLLHLPLGILLYNSPLFGLLHPLGILCVGLYFAFQDESESWHGVAYATAYLTGSEILWRMSESLIFWEFGKYGISFIMITAIVRRGLSKIPILPTVYFVLLLPACFLTLFNSELSEARSELSSNLSGPLLLFVSCVFFSYLQFDWWQVRRFFFALLLPGLSVGATTLFYTVTTPDIAFNTESNLATSGGFGPNQVSAILGLGVFSALFCLIMLHNYLGFKIYLAIAAIFLAVQSMLTFSRGGIYNALGAIGVVVLMQSGDFKKIAGILTSLILLTAIFMIFLFPVINDFTGGLLQERFEDTGTTNRSEIIETDFQILAENPIFGVGVGEAKFYRKQISNQNAASHTEFVRLVSEHGLLGIAALVVLFAMAVMNFMKQESLFGKTLVIGVIFWSSFYMLNSGMRLSIPAFIWGFSFVEIVRFGTSQNLRERD